jgi:hypothetical protein
MIKVQLWDGRVIEGVRVTGIYDASLKQHVNAIRVWRGDGNDLLASERVELKDVQEII